MSTPVDLKTLAEELSAALHTMDVFVNTTTGEVAPHCDDWDLAPDEVPDFDLPEWMLCPRPDEEDDSRTMLYFAREQSDAIRDDLVTALSLERPFRNFRKIVDRHGLRDAWSAYQDDALVDFARAWLDSEHVAYTEASPIVSEGPQAAAN